VIVRDRKRDRGRDDRGGKEREGRRRRRWPRVLASLVIIAAGAAAAIVLIHRHDLGSGHGPGTVPVRLVAASAYDPEGDHHDDNRSATDGNPEPYWSTEVYRSQSFGNLKSGVGLILDAGAPVKLRSLTITSTTPGYTAVIRSAEATFGSYADDSAPATAEGS